MIDGDHRLDAVLQAFVKNIVIEPEAFFIHIVHSVGTDAGPDNGHTEAFEAHLRKKSDIFLIVMVEVRCHVTGIVELRRDIAGGALGQ